MHALLVSDAGCPGAGRRVPRPGPDQREDASSVAWCATSASSTSCSPRAWPSSRAVIEACAPLVSDRVRVTPTCGSPRSRLLHRHRLRDPPGRLRQTSARSARRRYDVPASDGVRPTRCRHLASASAGPWRRAEPRALGADRACQRCARGRGRRRSRAASDALARRLRGNGVAARWRRRPRGSAARSGTRSAAASVRSLPRFRRSQPDLCEVKDIRSGDQTSVDLAELDASREDLRTQTISTSPPDPEGST